MDPFIRELLDSLRDFASRPSAGSAWPPKKNGKSLRFDAMTGARSRSTDDDDDYEEDNERRTVAKKRKQLLQESRRRSLMGILYFGGGVLIGLLFLGVYLFLRHRESGPIGGVNIQVAANGGNEVVLPPMPDTKPGDPNPMNDPKNDPPIGKVPQPTGPIKTLKPSSPLPCISFSADETKYVAATTFLGLYDIGTLKRERILRISKTGGAYNQAFMSADGTRFYCSMNGPLIVSDLNQNELGTLPIGSNRCAMSPDRRMILGASGDGSLQVCDVTTMKLIKELLPPWAKTGKRAIIQSLAWSQDGKRAVTCDFSNLICWDMVQMREVFRMQVKGGGRLALSPDNHTVAISSQFTKSTYLVDIDKQQVTGTLAGAADVFHMSFFAGGEYLMATPTKCAVLDIYDVRAMNKITTWDIPGGGTAMANMVVAPSGRFALTSTTDAIHYWPLPAGRVN